MSELRIGLRRLLHSPGYVAAAVVSLAIGIAVCVAVFSLVNVMVFEDVPGLRDRRNLLRISWAGAGLFSSQELETLEQVRPSTLTSLAAQGDRALPVILPSGPTTLAVAIVSPRFFETLGTRPIVGRLLAAADASAEAPPAAMVAEELWRGAFNATADIAGRSIVVGGRAFAIVGVVPARSPGLRLVDLGTQGAMLPQVWVGLRHAVDWRAASASSPWLTVAARLAPDADVQQTRARLAAVAGRVKAASQSSSARAEGRPPSLLVFRGGLDWRDDPGQALLTLAVFLFVPISILAIACINVMSLQLARGLEQSAELSVRLALGASRARLVRLMMLEVVVISGLAGLGGWLGARLLLARIAAYLPSVLAIDYLLFGAAVVLVVLVVSVAGLGPAWVISRELVAAGLKSLDLGGPTRSRARGALLFLQVATSVALLALSAMVIRSLTGRTPFLPAAASEILMLDVNLANVRAPDPRPAEFIGALIGRLQDDGAIAGAAVASFGAAGHRVEYALPADPSATRRVATGGFVTPGWFAAAGAAFLAGAPFGEAPGGPQQAVVSAAFAATLSADSSAVLGAKLRRPGGEIVEIVGVVADTERSGSGAPLPMLFLPLPLRPPAAFTTVVRTHDLSAGRHALESAVRSIDPLVPIGRVETLDARTAASFKGFREMTSYGVALGALALALTAAGLYSLLAYTVRRRTREIGIRLAIGASNRQVMWTVISPAAWLLVAGTVAGIALAVPIATILQATLLGLSPLDPLALAGSVGVLALVTLAATAPPVRRAARIDPSHALREL